MTDTSLTALSTVRAVVDALGGTGQAAATLGVGTSSVSNWLAWGHFPDRASTLVSVRDACAALGLAVDERLFGSPVVHHQPQPDSVSP